MIRIRPGRGANEKRMACVLGEIDLVTALGKAGIRSAVASVPGDPAGYSKYARERVVWFDPWERSEEMLASLMEWGESQVRRPVLFYNGDHDLLLVSRNRDLLKRAFDFVIAEQQLVEDLVDKERFSELARRLELPVPPNICLDPARFSIEDVDLSFPVVVKPVTRRDDRWRPIAKGGKALRFENKEMLERGWREIASQGRTMIQTLIPGEEDRIESYHFYASDEGEILCDFTGRKIRTLPARFGDTTALETTNAPDVSELGRDLVAKLAVTGVGKLDFKRDPQERLWLLEVNPRFNLWHHVGAAAGANIPALVFDRLTGERDRRDCEARPGVSWCHPTRDVRAARRKGISTVSWLRWQTGCSARWGGSVRDPMPFVRGVVIRRAAARLRSR